MRPQSRPDNGDMVRDSRNSVLNVSTSPSIRGRAQKTAYLLGASQTMPELSQEEINQMRAIQACDNAMSGVDADAPTQDRSSTDSTNNLNGSCKSNVCLCSMRSLSLPTKLQSRSQLLSIEQNPTLSRRRRISKSWI
jgi:hypothetical protein